jgi:hypothetical protein
MKFIKKKINEKIIDFLMPLFLTGFGGHFG